MNSYFFLYTNISCICSKGDFYAMFMYFRSIIYEKNQAKKYVKKNAKKSSVLLVSLKESDLFVDPIH